MSLAFHSQAHDFTGEINQRGEAKTTRSDSWVASLKAKVQQKLRQPGEHTKSSVKCHDCRALLLLQSPLKS